MRRNDVVRLGSITNFSEPALDNFSRCIARCCGPWLRRPRSCIAPRAPIFPFRIVSQRSDHLIVSENPLFSFLALFAALFSIKVLTGFFLFCFLLSLPLLMLVAPYIWVS
jgi:hypothetical protein